MESLEEGERYIANGVEEEEEEFWEWRDLVSKEVKITGDRGMLSVLTLPLHNKFLVYKAELVNENCLWERQRFLPLSIQYRPRMQEQHIHTNATAFSLRFHHTTDDSHTLVLITDPGCDYALRLTLDIKGMIAQYAHAYVSTFVSLPLCIFLLVAARQFRSSPKPNGGGVALALPSGLKTMRVTLFRLLPVILVIVPVIELFFYDPIRSLFRTLFAALPGPLGSHSFSDHVQATPPLLAICLLALLALPIVTGVHLLLDLSLKVTATVLTAILPVVRRKRLLAALSGRMRLAVAALLVAVGYQTHGLPPLLLAMAYLFLSCANIQTLLQEKGIEDGKHRARFQTLVLMLSSWLAVERAVSFVVWLQGFQASIRVDDSSLLLLVLPVFTCLLAVSFAPSKRFIPWFACVSGTWFLLFYALVPFYRSLYVVCYTMAVLMLCMVFL
mmetsp:Transcript_21463/g.83245  ORF Transcript_21463/g.83245 Transcript_21463/m.83245 type:complete len:443 (-) Transcript_21463:1976-3304(-)